MSDLFIQPVIGNLGSNPCFETEQDRYRAFILATVWKVPFGVSNGVIIAEDEPSVEDRDKMWFKIGTDAALALPVPLVYSTTYARWVGRHPKQKGAGSNLEMWTGTEAELKTYDGGEDIGITPTTGPMWEIVSAMENLIPIGVQAAGVATAPLEVQQVFDVSTPADPQLVGVYFIRRTERIYYTV